MLEWMYIIFACPMDYSYACYTIKQTEAVFPTSVECMEAASVNVERLVKNRAHKWNGEVPENNDDLVFLQICVEPKHMD